MRGKGSGGQASLPASLTLHPRTSTALFSHMVALTRRVLRTRVGAASASDMRSECDGICWTRTVSRQSVWSSRIQRPIGGVRLPFARCCMSPMDCGLGRLLSWLRRLGRLCWEQGYESWSLPQHLGVLQSISLAVHNLQHHQIPVFSYHAYILWEVRDPMSR